MKSHWTFNYFVARVPDYIYEKMHRNEPWLNSKIIEALDSLLRPTDTMVECGSGRSTIWFAARVGKLVSIENVPEWGNRVHADLMKNNLSNVLQHIVQYDLSSCQAENEYIDVIRALDDNSIDVALVDGGPRSHCALELIPKLTRGGLLVIDDIHNIFPSKSKSPYAVRTQDAIPTKYLETVDLIWPEVYHLIMSWRCLWMSNNSRDTAIYFKPSLDS